MENNLMKITPFETFGILIAAIMFAMITRLFFGV